MSGGRRLGLIAIVYIVVVVFFILQVVAMSSFKLTGFFPPKFLGLSYSLFKQGNLRNKAQSQSSKRTQEPVLISLNKSTIFHGRSIETIKVVSDVDDTIVSSGGLKLFGIPLGGLDNRYKRGQFYPGVVQFAFELSNSKAENKNTQSKMTSKVEAIDSLSSPSKISILTARAKEFKFALAIKPTSKYNRKYSAVGKQNGFTDWGIGDVYYGSVAEWILQFRKGIRKFRNFEIMVKKDQARLSSLAGDSKNNDNGTSTTGSTSSLMNFKYILMGDTGEKDEDLGERMALHYPDKMKAVFLHKVYTIRPPSDQKQQSPQHFFSRLRRKKHSKSVPSSSNNSNVVSVVGPMKALHRHYSDEMPSDRLVNGVPFYYFRTYIGAAIKAYKQNILSEAAVKRIAKASIEDLQGIDELTKLAPRRKRRFFLTNLSPLSSSSSSLSSPSSLSLITSTKRLQQKHELLQTIQSMRWKELENDLKLMPFLQPYVEQVQKITTKTATTVNDGEKAGDKK